MAANSIGLVDDVVMLKRWQIAVVFRELGKELYNDRATRR